MRLRVKKGTCLSFSPALPGICALIFCAGKLSAGESVPKLDFNRDIQPILSDNCYFCHGQDKEKRKADLRLDVEKEAKRTRDGVTVIAPGNGAGSELIKRILSSDPDEVMPTPKSNRKLTERQKQILKQWIDQGAVWGKHWAFEPVQKPRVPGAPKPGSSMRNPIDSFVLARLEREKLPASPEAPRETLIRRLSLDLIGLPPTPAEVDAFERDASPQAYEHVVDRLLKSPHYGERWCWDWLDAARYADTNGYQGDPERTMWPWRDWVVKVINDNMSYDQFTVWQLAGDLLPNATKEQKLATGFHRNHMMNGEGGRIPEESRVENVMDRVETTATVWLGLTMGCSKCHDHKFDPFTMRDYYALYDFFNQTSETGQGRGGQAVPAMDMSTPQEEATAKTAQQKVKSVAAEVAEFELEKFPRAAGAPLKESEAKSLPGNLPATLAAVEPAKRNVDGLLEAIGYFKGKDDAYVKILERLLAAVRKRDSAVTKVTKVMIMDTLPQARDTFMLVKGAYDKPTTDRITANVPASLPALRHGSAPVPTRLDLAEWLVSRENPLTSRVTVNRFWQAFFGTGLVKTVEDFGLQGEKPSHPELLDWLAAEFMESGWDVKALHKLIVMSATYRQSSKVTPRLYERDPENRLLARGPRFRMPSWMMRDTALFASGLLQEKLGGPSVMPYQPEGIWEEATFGKKSYRQDHGDSLYRRSLYTFWRRIVGPTMFFDNTTRQTCYVRAIRTNTPLHALTTLNDVQYVEAARALAQCVLESSSSDSARLDEAFRRVLSRRPQADERILLLRRLQFFKLEFSQDKTAADRLVAVGESGRDEKLNVVEHAAWTALAQLILNLDEAITKE